MLKWLENIKEAPSIVGLIWFTERANINFALL